MSLLSKKVLTIRVILRIKILVNIYQTFYMLQAIRVTRHCTYVMPGQFSHFTKYKTQCYTDCLIRKYNYFLHIRSKLGFISILKANITNESSINFNYVQHFTEHKEKFADIQ